MRVWEVTLCRLSRNASRDGVIIGADRDPIATQISIFATRDCRSWFKGLSSAPRVTGGIRFDAGGGLIAGAACLAWGLDNNLTRKLSSADPVVTTMIKGLVAGIVNVGLALSVGSSLPSIPLIGAATMLGFLSVGVSLILFVLALRHLGTTRTGAYFSLAPFIGAVVAIFLRGEPPTLQLALAGLLMGWGLWLHLAERHEHEHQHEILEHEHSHVHDEHHRHLYAENVSEPHSHWHRHEPLLHKHPHDPDLHHRHRHG